VTVPALPCAVKCLVHAQAQKRFLRSFWGCATQETCLQ
jgi:hypothetical protein